MRSVNLLPSDLASVRRPVNRTALAGVAGTSALTMLLAAGYLNAHSGVQDRQATLSGLQAELAALPKPKVENADNAALAAERAGRVAALSGALSGRIGWDRLLREVSAVLPADVWLTSMNANAPASITGAPAPAPAPTDPAAQVASVGGPFKIEGHTYTYEGLARLLARLALVPDLTEPKLDSSALTEIAGQPAVKFIISALLRPSGATS